MKVLRVIIGIFLGLMGAGFAVGGILTVNAARDVGMPLGIDEYLKIPLGIGQFVGAALLPFKLRAGVRIGTWATGAIGTLFALRAISATDLDFVGNLFEASLMLLLALALQAYVKPKPSDSPQST